MARRASANRRYGTICGHNLPAFPPPARPRLRPAGSGTTRTHAGAWLPCSRDAFPSQTQDDWSGHLEQPAADSRPELAEGEATPWLPDASASRSSATGSRPSCPTSIRTRPGSGSSRSTRSCRPAAADAPATSCCGCWSGPVSSRSACPACAAPTTSTRSRRSASRGSPATSTSSAGSAPTSAGTPAIMVSRANRPGLGVGGHIATYASARQPVRGGLQPLLPRQGPRRVRRPGLLPGPRGAGHLRPRVPRGPADRGAAGRVPPGDCPTPAAACRPTRTRG